MCNKDFLSTSGSSTPTRDILIPRFLLKVRNTLIQSSTRLSHFPEGETTQKSRQGIRIGGGGGGGGLNREEGLINFPPLKKGGLLGRGSLF